jgi:uncharacterized protein (DUF305 family)
MKRTIFAVVSTAATALLLAACGSSNHNAHPGSSSSSSAAVARPSMSGMDMGSGTPGSAAPKLSISGAAAHNAADVTFVQLMTPHHSQAIDMANKEVIDGSNAQVKALAKKIMAAQSPEINQMNGWMKAWGIAPAGHQGNGSMGSMSGMMSDADMATFQKAKGAQLDRMFLEMMITHHEGAVTMGKTELLSGSNTEAKALAQSIITGQSKEIATMQQLLAGL